jgi:hypothetical protein
MSKLNYFDSLERLSVLSSRAVFLACSPSKSSVLPELTSIRNSSDQTLCELELTLFSDFIPPLDRADISSCAHGLCRIIEKCSDIISHKTHKNSFSERKNKEAELCIRLSQLIDANIIRLRRVKHPKELPDIIEFRKLLCDAQHAHAALQKKLASGVYPRSAQHSLCLLGSLRCELSRAFDDLVEVMLNNI